MTQFTLANIVDYLIDNEHLERSESTPSTTVKILTGGVSNLTMLIETPLRSMVVKQSLGQLKVKGEWLADRSRIFREAAAIAAYSNVLDDDEIPGLLFVGEDNFAIGIEAIKRPAVVWQDAISEGVVMPGHARLAGQLLARMHTAVSEPAHADLLADLSHLDELRIKPYFDHAAISNPQLAGQLALASERLKSDQTHLVHGDFAPKNLFIRATRPQVTVLDFEVAHLGNPAFDLAFFLSHLVIDAHHSPSLTSDLLTAARGFWAGYQATAKVSSTAVLERDTALILTCLLLARVDGLSTVDYLSDSEANAVRRTAYELFSDAKECIHQSIEDAFSTLQLTPA